MKFMFVLAICLLGCFLLSEALACVYTVRDVGFAEIGSAPYRLYFYTKDDTPKEVTSAFKQISYAALMDSNVEALIINTDEQNTNLDGEAEADHDQAMKYFNFWEIQSFPAAILASPKGRSLVLPISVPGKTFKETVWSILEESVISPKRKDIISSIISNYCAVTFIQSGDKEKDKKAKKAIDDAVQELSNIMSQMPKSIEKPPRVITINPESFSGEKILLWGLGVETPGATDDAEPYVAVIYGRGRRIGKLLKGEAIKVNEIFNTLSIIGESCECGVDRGWLLGTTIPLRWGGKAQSELVKHLGFDVENPMVRTEMSQILSQGMSAETSGLARNIGSPLEEYSETLVEFESAQAGANVSPAQFRQLVSPKTADTDISRQGFLRLYRTALIITGSIALLALVGGTFIILRAHRRKL